jgi:hypothetical protein
VCRTMVTLSGLTVNESACYFFYSVAEAYTTRPNKERYTYERMRLRSNAVGGGGGGGGTILKLGLGRCSYDASTGLPPGLEVGGLEV